MNGTLGYGWSFGVWMELWGMKVPTLQIETPDQNYRPSSRSKLQIKPKVKTPDQI